MHQQTYCHTLSKPFFKIFLFRIYAPTIHSIDIDFDETSDRLPHISAPNHPPQTNPPTTPSTHPQIHTPQIPRPYSLHTHTASTPIQPPQKHTPTRRSPGPADADVDAVDVDAQPASSGLTVRPSGRMQTQPPASPQFDRLGTGSGHTKTDSIRPRPQLDRPGTKQAAYRIRLNQIRQTRLN